MNRIERLFSSRGEAKVRFKHGEYQVTTPGDYVRCAVTGREIRVADLKYWNVDLQEAYCSAEVALQRYLELRKAGRVK